MTLLSLLSAAGEGSRGWLVQHRDGWCATKTGMRPAESRDSVPTRCGHFVILPYGYEQGEPDCPECLAALQARLPTPTPGAEERG